mgnify:CR=1 FL=1
MTTGSRDRQIKATDFLPKIFVNVFACAVAAAEKLSDGIKQSICDARRRIMIAVEGVRIRWCKNRDFLEFDDVCTFFFTDFGLANLF